MLSVLRGQQVKLFDTAVGRQSGMPNVETAGFRFGPDV